MRKSDSASKMVDSEELIKSIHIRPPIWDRNTDEYRNKEYVLSLWEEVSNECNAPVQVLKVRWKNLRDTFRTEHRKCQADKSYESRWVWYKKLLFITGHMHSRKESNYFPVDGEKKYCLNITTDNSRSTSPAAPKRSYIKREKNADEIEFIDIGGKRRNDNKSDDTGRTDFDDTSSDRRKENRTGTDLELFLNSLHKPMCELPLTRQMYLRMRFQELIFNEIEALQTHTSG